MPSLKKNSIDVFFYSLFAPVFSLRDLISSSDPIIMSEDGIEVLNSEEKMEKIDKAIKAIDDTQDSKNIIVEF